MKRKRKKPLKMASAWAMSTQILFIFVNFEPDRRRFRRRKEEIMEKYYIIDKRDRNAEAEAKAYTFETENE